MEKQIRKKSIIKTFRKEIYRFLKYQLGTQILLLGIIFPMAYKVMESILHWRGMEAISNNTLLELLESGQGVLFLAGGLLLILLILLIEIGGIVTISGQTVLEKPQSAYRTVLWHNLKYFPKLWDKGTLLILLYLSLIIPLTGLGNTISLFDEIKIPNFIQEVIDQTASYRAIYLVGIFLLLMVGLRWVFSFHFMFIGGYKPYAAISASTGLVKRNRKPFYWHLAKLVASLSLLFILAYGMEYAIVVGLIEKVNADRIAIRVALIALILAKHLFVAVMTLLIIPFEFYHLTVLFFEMIKLDDEIELDIDYMNLTEREKPSIMDRVLTKKKSIIFLVIIVCFSIALPIGIFFEEAFLSARAVDIMGHRCGGYDAPENTLSGIETSIKNGAQWVELDVQRSKDGFYVLNHDDSFKRVAGVKKRVSQMTLKEIKALDVGAYQGFDSEKVPTIEEVIGYSKRKIKLNIELKGTTANRQMADDIVKLVKENHLEDRAILTSLDYNLVSYIHDQYPTIKTGFIYFMALGDISKFKADYLIVEEGSITESKIDQIHQAGKKIIVWTINTEASMDYVLDFDIDGVITDRVKQMNQKILEKQKTSTEEELVKLFVN